jgi:nitrogen fixation protein NifU and related proteins
VPIDGGHPEESRELREALILDLARSRPGFQRPLGGGAFEAERSTPTCGDRIRVRVEIRDGVVTDAGWDGRGCAVSSASAAVLSGLVPGLRLEQLPGLLDRVRSVVAPHGADAAALEDVGDMRLFAGIGRLPLRGRCAMLAWEALADAVRDLVPPGGQPTQRQPTQGQPS